MKVHKIFFFIGMLIIPTASFAKTRAFFSPKGGCEREIVDLISTSKNKIDVAVYSLNNERILAAMEKAKLRKVKIRILTDHTQAGSNAKSTLQIADDDFDLRLHSVGKIMHNKFAVFDDAKIVTGSFNWTGAAEHINEENCIIIDEAEVVTRFTQRFNDHLWSVNSKEKSDQHLAKIRKKYESKRLSEVTK